MADLHARITDTILRQIEAEPGTWSCPWHRVEGGLPRNALTGRAYRGINILSLWSGALSAGFVDPRWATYRQWAELRAQVRRGEQGTPVVFYKDLPPGAQNEDGSDRRFVTRVSVVFNAAQVIGAPDLPEAGPQALSDTAAFDRFVGATGAIVREGDMACYIPSLDEIRIPARNAFRSGQGYCATLAHELVHWTSAKPRLDRNLSTRFGSGSYAAEELIAELGAAFVLAGLGVAPTPHPNHASYIANWLPLLRSDPRAIFTAAAHASRAADYLAASQTGSRVGEPKHDSGQGSDPGTATLHPKAFIVCVDPDLQTISPRRHA